MSFAALLFSMWAISSAQLAPEPSTSSAAGANAPVMAGCTAGVILHFGRMTVPVTFEVARRETQKRPFNFAEESKRKMTRYCNGDECSCDVVFEECEAQCPPVEDPAYDQCDQQCTQRGIRCSFACCGRD